MYITKNQLEAVLHNILTENDVTVSSNKFKKITKEFFLAIEELILNNPQGVMLGNLGKLKIVLRQKRNCFNIKTRQKIEIPAKHALVLRVSSSFKRKLIERIDSSL